MYSDLKIKTKQLTKLHGEKIMVKKNDNGNIKHKT